MRSVKRLRTPGWGIAGAVVVLVVVVGVVLAAVALLRSSGHEHPAETPASRVTETQDPVSPESDDPSGVRSTDAPIPSPGRRPRNVSHGTASEAVLDRSADRASERSLTRAVSGDRDVGTATEGSTDPAPTNREPASLDRSRLTHALVLPADEDSATADTESARREVAALPSRSDTNADPEQATAPEKQPTETASGEVDSSPVPDRETGQESPARSGEATISAGFQRDQHEPGDDEPEAARDPRLADVRRSLAANEGPIYTWQDGDRTRRVRLVEQLVVQPSLANRDDDLVIAEHGARSIVLRQARHRDVTEPVFRAESSGGLMTLPGGVLTALNPDWDASVVAGFFAQRGIAASRVSERQFTDNAFFIETAPGMASLELANELAALDGVVLAVPNWQREAVPR